MIILIDGFWGSGKTVLRSLLDGHKELLVSTSQESIFSSLYRNQKLKKFLDYNDIRVIRKYLADSHYNNLEHETLHGFLDSDLKKKKLNFDFFEFEKYWTHLVEKNKKWDLQSIFLIIHSSILKFTYNLDYLPINDKKIFLEDNNFHTHKYFLDNFENSKLVLVTRRLTDNLATLMQRKITNKDYKSSFYMNFNFEHLVKKEFFPEKILENLDISQQLKQQYKERVYICNFENLILNTKDEMLKICNFLNINYTKNLLEPTHLSEVINYKDHHQVTGKIKFSANNLNQNQFQILKFYEKKNKVSDYFKYTFIEYLILKLKYLIKKYIKNIFSVLPYEFRKK